MTPVATVLHVISGYLGSGKTTLINRIIGAPDAGRLCVIVNDFGALSVDAGVLARVDGTVLPLANGCVCCSAATGLYAAFDSALGLDPAPATVIVEASGVADPARIAAVARAEADFTPGGIFTLVDPGALVALLADPLIAPDVVRQVTSADVVLLSRTDILDTTVIENARSLVTGLSPLARVEDARGLATRRDIDDLLQGAPSHRPTLPDRDPHGARYGRMLVHGDRLVDVDRLAARLAALGEPSLRLKGIVRVEEREQRLDFTNGVLTIEPVDLAEPPATGFLTAVFLDRGDVRRKLQALAPDHLVED